MSVPPGKHAVAGDRCGEEHVQVLRVWEERGCDCVGDGDGRVELYGSRRGAGRNHQSQGWGLGALSLPKIIQLMSHANAINPGAELEHAAPEGVPAGKTIIGTIEMAAKATNGKDHIANGFNGVGMVQTQDIKFKRVEAGDLGRSIGEKASQFADIKQAQGDDTENGNRSPEAMGVLELEAFGAEAGFEGFMKFFDEPAGGIEPHDAKGVGQAGNGLIGEQNPFQGFDSGGRIGFPNPDHPAGDGRLLVRTDSGTGRRPNRDLGGGQTQGHFPFGLIGSRAQSQGRRPQAGERSCRTEQIPLALPRHWINQASVLTGSDHKLMLYHLARELLKLLAITPMTRNC